MTTTEYRDSWINPRFKIAALWVSTMFLFGYVDLFGLFRADVRADIEAGKMFSFSIGQGFLLAVTLYVAVPALMVFLSLVLPVKVTRLASIVLAVTYGLTIAGSAVGEWNYYILGSAIEAALLAGIVYYAWTWPKAPAAVATRTSEDSSSRRV
jgi:ABC-type proline/glycine betaine transport system permease subunit